MVDAFRAEYGGVAEHAEVQPAPDRMALHGGDDRDLARQRETTMLESVKRALPA